MKALDVKLLRDTFDYDAETGEIVRKSTMKVMTAKSASGYIHTSVPGIGKCVAHRIAWAIYYGEDPGKLHVDHIDNDKVNNRISNLRLATVSQNKVNVETKAWGIRKLKNNRWQARVRRGNRSWCRTHDCPLVAHVAYLDILTETFGEFA